MTDIPALLTALAALRDQHAAILAAQEAHLPASVRKAMAANAARFAPELATMQLGLTLQGYAATHAELLAFRSIGTPSVSLRSVKETA